MTSILAIVFIIIAIVILVSFTCYQVGWNRGFDEGCRTLPIRSIK